MDRMLVTELYKLICYFSDLKKNDVLEEAKTSIKIIMNTGNFTVVLNKMAPTILNQVNKHPEIMDKKTYDESMLQLVLETQFSDHYNMVVEYSKLIPEQDKQKIWDTIMNIILIVIKLY